MGPQFRKAPFSDSDIMIPDKKIILADFNLVVSTLAAKLPNLISPSKFLAVRY